MALTRKHFAAVAEILADAKRHADSTDPNANGLASSIVSGIAKDLSRILATQNGKFNESRFLQSCDPK